MNNAKVSIIIPVWNLWDMTAACLRSLAMHTREENVEIVVVDNGSTDATTTKLEALGRALWGAAFCPVRLTANLGFAGGCNAGAAAATGDLLFFLNNDTTVTPGWLPPLREALGRQCMGAVGPLLLYPNGTIQHCGIFFTPFLQVGHLYEGFPGGHPVPRNKRPLQAITGAAMLLRKDVFWECGGFFEGFRNGFEDLDLCFELRGKGYALAVEGRSVIVHHTSQTPGRFDHDNANGMLFCQRQARRLRPDLHILAALDGYELRLGPNLGHWLELPEAVEEKRNADFDARFTANEEACRAELEHEPLWRGGWHRLMDMLEARGDMTAALLSATRCVMFLGDEVSREKLLHLTAAVEGPDYAASVRAALTGSVGDDLAGAAKARVQRTRRAAYDMGDTLLAEVFNQWLLRYGRA
ncbi:glycosyltransferase [Desulfovibrio falkowii]|uniref:glycosyltransferase n=1 Tax=Desulfovibrio sp. WGS1351 TaxID=3366814 RepID=UPI00372D117A